MGMDLQDLVDPAHTALCVVECQNGVVGEASNMPAVADAVAAGGDKVSIPGWISFEQVHRAARMARNPQTGEPVHVAARNACKVSVGSKLKAAANSGGGAAEAAPEPSSW